MVPQVAIDAVRYLIAPPRSVAIGPAIGMVAVAYAGESNLKPGSQGNQSTETPGALNPHGAYGIWSLNGPLQESLKAFAAKERLPVENINTQLYWLLNTCASNPRYAAVWAAIREGMGYEQFIPLFVAKFEVPKAPGAEDNRSLVFARELDAAVAASLKADPVPSAAPAPAAPPAPATPSLPGALEEIEHMIAGVVQQLQPPPPPPIPDAPPPTGAPAPSLPDAGVTAVALTPVADAIIASVIRALIASTPGLAAAAPLLSPVAADVAPIIESAIVGLVGGIIKHL